MQYEAAGKFLFSRGLIGIILALTFAKWSVKDLFSGDPRLMITRFVFGGTGLAMQIMAAPLVTLPGFVFLSRLSPAFCLGAGLLRRASKTRQLATIMGLLLAITYGQASGTLSLGATSLTISSILIGLSLFLQTRVAAKEPFFAVLLPPSMALLINGIFLQAPFVTGIGLYGALSSLCMMASYFVFTQLVKRTGRYGLRLFTLDIAASILSYQAAFIAEA